MDLLRIIDHVLVTTKITRLALNPLSELVLVHGCQFQYTKHHESIHDVCASRNSSRNVTGYNISPGTVVTAGVNTCQKDWD